MGLVDKTGAAMPDMTTDEQVVYKNMVENLAFMKRQQWAITTYVVIILVGLFGLTQGKINPNAVEGLSCIVGAGCLLACYLLFRIQVDIATQRRSLENAAERHFTADQRSRFGMRYNHPFFHDFDFVVVFMLVCIATAWFVIFMWQHPSA